MLLFCLIKTLANWIVVNRMWSANTCMHTCIYAYTHAYMHAHNLDLRAVLCVLFCNLQYVLTALSTNRCRFLYILYITANLYRAIFVHRLTKLVSQSPDMTWQNTPTAYCLNRVSQQNNVVMWHADQGMKLSVSCVCGMIHLLLKCLCLFASVNCRLSAVIHWFDKN